MLVANEISRSWDTPAGARIEATPGGLINQTFGVWSGAHLFAVLQRLNTDIFVPEVHEDIEAVTQHLASKGLPTTRLLRTRTGGLWATDETGGAWRMLTPVGDRTIDSLTDTADAHSAGALVARFHAATADLQWDFRSVRAGAQDTAKHLANLAKALDDHRAHRLYDRVAPLAASVLDAGARIAVPDLPRRIIHGDLKISNLRFTGTDATALIDLDTLAWGSLEVDLGDALRSWCNPTTEDSSAARFDLALFEAAMRGYASDAADVTAAEWHSIVGGVARITLNLTARFAADALQESYFGWKPRFGTRGDHNLVRAVGQWELFSAISAHADEAQRILREIRPR